MFVVKTQFIILILIVLVLLSTGVSVYILYPDFFKSITVRTGKFILPVKPDTSPETSDLNPDNPPALTVRTPFRKTGEAWIKRETSWEKVAGNPLGQAYSLRDSTDWVVDGQIRQVNSPLNQIEVLFDPDQNCTEALELPGPGKVCGIRTLSVSQVLIYSIARDFKSNNPGQQVYREGTVDDLEKDDHAVLTASKSALLSGAGVVRVAVTQ